MCALSHLSVAIGLLAGLCAAANTLSPRYSQEDDGSEPSRAHSTQTLQKNTYSPQRTAVTMLPTPDRTSLSRNPQSTQGRLIFKHHPITRAPADQSYDYDNQRNKGM